MRFDSMFILTLYREYDENRHGNYVFLYLFITSRATMMTRKYSQLINGKWIELFEWIWFTIRHDKTIRYTLPSRMSLTSLVTVASKIPRRPSPRTSRNRVSENLKYCFANTQAEAHARITRNPTFQKTTTVDIKIMYTKTNTNKIQELQDVEFLQNKHWSVCETEQ